MTVFAAAVLLFGSSCSDAPPKTPLRIGHFPNVTHAHALVAQAMARSGDGIFEKHFGPGVGVEWLLFGAGPSAMDALRSGAIDATYVGPSPVLDHYTRPGNDGVVVLAGATNGGAALVVRAGAGITKPEDFRGRRIATPQLGNTQDVQCRAWLAGHGFHVSPAGSDVTVVPMPHAEQLALFQRGELDAAWTVEPWITLLERQGHGKVFASDASVTTVLAASTKFVREQPAMVAKLLAAHRELTTWIVDHADDGKRLVGEQLERVTGRRNEAEVIAHSWPRLQFTASIDLDDFRIFVDNARQSGLTDAAPDLSRLLHKH